MDPEAPQMGVLGWTPRWGVGADPEPPRWGVGVDPEAPQMGCWDGP